MTRNLFLFALAALTLCACATPEQTTAAVIGGGAAIVELSKLILPHLSAEDQAKVVGFASQAASWTNFLGNVVGNIADGLATAQAGVAQAQATAAEGITAGEMWAGGGAVGATSVAGARLMSVIKHGHAGRSKEQAA